MIRGVHTMFYSSQAEELRAFIRDVLGFSYTDVGEGWLIFDAPEADMGVHPSDSRMPHAQAGTHNVSFYCDDIAGTVTGLQAKGVEFTAPVEDHGYGLVTFFKMPGDVLVQLYQPHYVKRSASKPAPRRKARAPSPGVPAQRVASPKGRGSKKKAPPKIKTASRKMAKRRRR
jgi:hypothetical protein